jgi:FAD dependent oxidoreductase
MQRRHFLQQALCLAAISTHLSAAEMDADVAVIGGGVGGCAAALAALRNGMRVLLTEETDWIGGQLTSQAVPPDEHPWIERFGCTKSYRDYRNAVRQYYRDHYPLTQVAWDRAELNPGNGSVSRLAHEPRVSLAVLEAMLAPFVTSGRLTLLLLHRPEGASVSGDRVTGVTVHDLQHNRYRSITAKYFLDATEIGELLPLTKTEFVTGAESQAQTGEPHAASTEQPANNQSRTFCFAVDYLEGQDHTIERPRSYAQWRDYIPQLTPPWTGPLLSWTMCEPKTLKPREVFFDPNPPEKPRQKGMNLWTYRRILDRANFTEGQYPSDVSLVNWPQNDFWLSDLLTATLLQRHNHLQQAKQLSLSLLYWMQTEAPRPDGKQGWKGLRLRKDVTGTEDGLAKAAYIRESRRIQAEFTILEQYVAKTPANFADSVGVGCYRIDLHPSATGVNYIDIGCFPFQIPLGALIPKRVENLLPACKNLGTTHITNGCYRLHPVEWNIGEAAGALAAHAIQKNAMPRTIRNDKKLLADFQASLRAQGFELAWPVEQIHAV